MVFFRFLAAWPLGLLYGLSTLLYLLAYRVLGYRKAVVRDNITRCFPEKSESERLSIEKGFYRHLADVVVESIKGLSLSPREMEARFTMENGEETYAQLKPGQSLLAMTAHQGNWEWLLLGYSLRSKQSGWLPIVALYQTLSNRFFDGLMLSIRSRFGARMAPSQQVLRVLAASKKEPILLAMVSDQAADPQMAIRTTFLGRTTYFLNGAEKIARKSGMAVFYAALRKSSRGHYTFRFIPITLNPQEEEEGFITRRYAEILESEIRQQPSFWLWSHKRWKHVPPHER